MTPKEIKRLGAEWEALWTRVEEYTRAALEGRCHVDLACAAISEAQAAEVKYRCAQVTYAVESMGR